MPSERQRLASFFTVFLFPCLAVLAEDFPKNCSLPMQIGEIGTGADAFVQCGIEGETSSDGHQIQNRIKNNLCATGDAVTVSYGTFTKLQKTVQQQKVPHGGKLPNQSERDALKDVIAVGGAPVGEGTIVQFVAFLKDAHFPRGTETVNCKSTRQHFKDIHIDLLKKRGDTSCNSITAEMIPHFRPEVWEQITDIDDLANPLRITGQLFFDASHQACVENANTSPKRASLWEIHPVYAIDVCKNTSLSTCRADADSQWTPFHKWVEEHPAEEPPEN